MYRIILVFLGFPVAVFAAGELFNALGQWMAHEWTLRELWSPLRGVSIGYLLLYVHLVHSANAALRQTAERVREQFAEMRYRLFTPTRQQEDDWWRWHWPFGASDPLIHSTVTRGMYYDVWRAKLTARGYGPNAKPITHDVAKAVFLEIRNRHDPSDPSLNEAADVDELRLKFGTEKLLRRFQFWELNSNLVELRTGSRGFIHQNGVWEQFDNVQNVLEKGVPLSFNEARRRFPGVEFNVFERDYIEMGSRKSD